MRSLTSWIRHNGIFVIGWIAFGLLALKLFFPLYRFSAPLAYDVGIYRYLFVQYGGVWPPFVMPDLLPWAKEHPLGLFLFSTALLKGGIPVDWLVGWMWNAFALVLASVLAWIMGQREGRTIGVCTLIMALLSQAYFDGFAAMYWKTYAALLWMVLAFYGFERRRFFLGVLFSALVLITHHQTGLLLGLVLGSFCLLHIRSLMSKMRVSALFICVLAALFITIVYLPVAEEALLRHLPTLLSGWHAPDGSFPPPLFYVRITGILLLLGIGGWVWSLRRERGTLWQLTVFWSAVFVLLRLMFYRRFFLQLDFFLLPFAAMFFVMLWKRWKEPGLRLCLVVLLLVQGTASAYGAWGSAPMLSPETFAAAQGLSAFIPREATVIALEDRSALLLRGWLPYNSVGGPGLFDLSWSREEWEKFLLGSHGERQELLRRLKGSVYLFVSPFFRSYYGEYAAKFLKDECFEETESGFLVKVSEECLNDD
ncbi:hypothetical protein A2635_02715 [Candidatus Peribacteria bacterium RIFCSPHIGHO2_01_FULL_51_9]|nr:MAG: hypothetical protein A2635_02715 [Candidatus Peribacteria bacterium RIFCSPHIGHO2_01_FULL_51_9]